MACVRFANFVKHFSPTVLAVAGVNLDIADGALMIFIGPSGCGTTTTLTDDYQPGKQPTSSQVIRGKRLVNAREPGERGLGPGCSYPGLFTLMTTFTPGDQVCLTLPPRAVL